MILNYDHFKISKILKSRIFLHFLIVYLNAFLQTLDSTCHDLTVRNLTVSLEKGLNFYIVAFKLIKYGKRDEWSYCIA